MDDMTKRLQKAKRELQDCLSNRIIPFWLDRSVDEEYGGYLTCFDADGKYTGNGTKYIVTQSRMVWGFSNLREFARSQDLERVEHAARQGAEFLMNAFWDDKYQGYNWQLNRDGSIADP